jgi:serine/threonine protein kinase
VRARRLQEGETFAGRYRVEAFVGQGAMGSVYRALDTRSGEARALKVMSGDLASSPEFVERFLLEAKIGETIESEHVVRVFDSGVDDKTKLPYFAMEMLSGEDLHRVLERGHELDPSVAKLLLSQLFAAMAAAHAANVVHRDLKPENLFVVDIYEPGRAPSLKVLDFGVAKVVRETTAGGTAPGLGTPLWAAPEQGKEAQIIKPSSDVWALGLIAYRLLAGKVFWKGASSRSANAFELAVEMLREPIPPASDRSRDLGARDLGPAFDAWFSRSVDRDPTKRFADAGEAWAALAPILEEDVDPARPAAEADARRSAPQVIEVTSGSASSGRRALTIVVAVLVGLAVAAAIVWLRGG